MLKSGAMLYRMTYNDLQGVREAGAGPGSTSARPGRRWLHSPQCGAMLDTRNFRPDRRRYQQRYPVQW